METKPEETKPEETCRCPGCQHGTSESKYPKNNVPKRLFHKDPNNLNSKLLRECFDCRNLKSKLAKEKREILRILSKKVDKDSEFQLCPTLRHTKCVSNYPREKVPKHLFRKDPNDPKSEICETCFDCRSSGREQKHKVAAEIKSEAEAESRRETEADSNVKYCTSERHNTLSEYKREEVPKHMFRRYPEDPRSPLFEHCLDCRDSNNNYAKKSINERREKVKDGEFFCYGCCNIFPCKDKAIKLNGEEAGCCVECRIKQKKWNDFTTLTRIKIKIEYIQENNCSCVKCKKIFLRPEANTNTVVELPTFEIDGVRYVKYKDKTYLAHDFLKEFEKLLEDRILEYDHLTEEEQRERGLLGENDIFIPKNKSVTDMRSEGSIRLESLKTQLICSRCHAEETLRRNPFVGKQNDLYQNKLAHINKLKSQGCSQCGFYNPDILRFLEFDHLDPNRKVTTIARMLDNPKYTLEELISETNELITRVLCRFCHTIHSDHQRQEKIFWK